MAVMTPPPRDFDRLCRPRLPRFRDSWVSIEILDDSDHRYTTKIDGSRSDAIRDTMKLPKVAYF
jgi:hypothetical protein